MGVLLASGPSMSSTYMAVYMNTCVHTPSQRRCQCPLCRCGHRDSGSLRSPCYVTDYLEQSWDLKVVTNPGPSGTHSCFRPGQPAVRSPLGSAVPSVSDNCGSVGIRKDALGRQEGCWLLFSVPLMFHMRGHGPELSVPISGMHTHEARCLTMTMGNERARGIRPSDLGLALSTAMTTPSPSHLPAGFPETAGERH